MLIIHGKSGGMFGADVHHRWYREWRIDSFEYNAG